MRVLLDEMLDHRLKGLLPAGTEALTVRERGWGALQNGEPRTVRLNSRAAASSPSSTLKAQKMAP